MPGPKDRPRGFQLTQIILGGELHEAVQITEGSFKKSLRADLITFKVRLFRIVELTFLVTIPAEGSFRAPVYVRGWIDAAAGDAPGSVVIE